MDKNPYKIRLSPEDWKKSYEHRFDNRKDSVKIDILGNKKYGRNARRRSKLTTPEWLLKGGTPPKNIKYDKESDIYIKIRKCYVKRGYQTREKRLARTKRSGSNEPASINDIC